MALSLGIFFNTKEDPVDKLFSNRKEFGKNKKISDSLICDWLQ